MKNSRGLLYPALHKFYSALKNLEKFEKGKNFFDNISYLDSFFSEYRNITFMLQKSLTNTPYITAYERLRDQYLINNVGKWFKEKRNEVLKQQPFNLEKRVLISIYSGRNTLTLPELNFTIDNDINISTIEESLRTTFLSFGEMEVMFSVEFSFYEDGKNEELYDNFILGINQMKLLIADLKGEIKESCQLSEELEMKIKSMNFYRVPKDFLFIDDYIFYSNSDSFEKAARIETSLDQANKRAPIGNLNMLYPNGNIFNKFELMNIINYQMQRTLLSTFLILYSDDTFELNSFGFSIKTTLYRKAVEISKRVEKDKISAVYFVSEMYNYNFDEIVNLNSRDRIKLAVGKILAFYMIDSNLETRNSSYDTIQIDDLEYVTSVMFSEFRQQVAPKYMNPIVKEFTRLKEGFNKI